MDSQTSKRNAHFHQNLLLVIIIPNNKTDRGRASYPSLQWFWWFPSLSLSILLILVISTVISVDGQASDHSLCEWFWWFPYPIPISFGDLSDFHSDFGWWTDKHPVPLCISYFCGFHTLSLSVWFRWFPQWFQLTHWQASDLSILQWFGWFPYPIPIYFGHLGKFQGEFFGWQMDKYPTPLSMVNFHHTPSLSILVMSVISIVISVDFTSVISVYCVTINNDK